MPIFDVRTLDEEMKAALVQQRLVAVLSTCFGALALLLAAVGLCRDQLFFDVLA
ncbi:MAG TPA: hypothetical protein VMO26_08915 [Vicinamibacterales bacterium]|nr:hypothetical protein [Vicinamibacterales bacterium]